MISKGCEVFRKVINKSVRGIVADATEDIVIVVWTIDGEAIREKIPVSEVEGNIFEDEKELIRACGKDLVELAPPRKIFLKYAEDFYGAQLQENDFVIAMAGEALYHKLEGYVKNIYYLSNMGYKSKYLDLIGSDGRVVAERCDAKMFSIPERFNEDNA